MLEGRFKQKIIKFLIVNNFPVILLETHDTNQDCKNDVDYVQNLRAPGAPWEIMECSA